MHIRFIVLLIFLFASSIAFSQPMSFVLKGNGGNCQGCEWVAAEGDITSDTPEILKSFLKKNNYRLNFTFDSPGGSLIAGMEIGEILRKHGASTSIGKTVRVSVGDSTYSDTTEGKCLSACAYAYLGGETRNSVKGLGFHQFYDERILDGIDKAFTAQDRVLDQYLTGVIVSYLIRMRIDVRLYELIASTPPDKIYYLTKQEMKKFGVDIDDFGVTSWTLRPVGNGFFSELSTLEVKSRRVSFFCTTASKTEYHFRMSIPNNYYGDNTYSTLADTLSYYEGLTVNGNQVTNYVHALSSSKDRFSIQLSFSKKSAIQIVEDGNFTLSSRSGNVANVDQPIFNILSLYSINGDSAYPNASIKHCVGSNTL